MDPTAIIPVPPLAVNPCLHSVGFVFCRVGSDGGRVGVSWAGFAAPWCAHCLNLHVPEMV